MCGILLTKQLKKQKHNKRRHYAREMITPKSIVFFLSHSNLIGSKPLLHNSYFSVPRDGWILAWVNLRLLMSNHWRTCMWLEYVSMNKLPYTTTWKGNSCGHKESMSNVIPFSYSLIMPIHILNGNIAPIMWWQEQCFIKICKLFPFATKYIHHFIIDIQQPFAIHMMESYLLFL